MPSPALEIAPCPVCGSAAAREVAGPDEIRAEAETLWAFHTKRLRARTPPERLTDRVAFSQHPPLRVARCAECGLVYRNPRERERELTDMYAAEPVDAAVLRVLFETQRASYRAQAARLSEVAGRAGSGLEVGSYVGGFLAAARELGWRFEGLDINERAADFARGMGFTVTIGTLETFDPGRRFDVVALWNCFDQLPDPRRAVAAARRLLGPGGVIAVRVPNGAFYAALRPLLRGPLAPAARALLAHNNLLTFPYRHGFTLGSLGRLFAASGFEVVRTHGDVLVPIADEWTRRWAAAEERALKGVLRVFSRSKIEAAPWIEVYGRLSRPAGAS